jgi:hypothetical protein
VNQLREIWSFRFLSGVLAVYLLNISIDPQDISVPWQQENLYVNEIESIVELIAEEILNYNNAVPEHEDADGEKNAHVSFFKLFSPSVFLFTLFELKNKIKLPDVNFPSRLIKQSADVAAPPPRA